MYTHIMLPLDGSELSLKAVEEGFALAKALGSKVTVITVVSPYHTGVTAPFTSGLVHEIEKSHDVEAKKAAQKLHADVAARAKAAGIQCESLVSFGDSAYVQIIDNAEASKCDLILMASHGRRGLDGFLLGSETVKVLTHSKIPVLVVR
jgi:nucleotide-binding universal stress UspA family protein